MPSTELVVYGTDWCGDCRRTRRYLERRNIPFTWINIDQDKNAEAFVVKTNRGLRSVPTLLFPDGSILVEPSNLTLAEKLGIPV
jgi:mycoredoxin